MDFHQQQWMFALATISIFISIVLFGSYLAKILRGRISLFVLDLFNVGAAGMFLAMACFHIIPEVVMDLLTAVQQSSAEKWKSLYLRKFEHDGHVHHKPNERFFREYGPQINPQMVDTGNTSHGAAAGNGHGHSHGDPNTPPGFMSLPHDDTEALEGKLQLMGVTLFGGYSLILFFERVFALWFTPKSSPAKEHHHASGCHAHGNSLEDGEDFEDHTCGHSHVHGQGNNHVSHGHGHQHGAVSGAHDSHGHDCGSHSHGCQHDHSDEEDDKIKVLDEPEAPEDIENQLTSGHPGGHHLLHNEQTQHLLATPNNLLYPSSRMSDRSTASKKSKVGIDDSAIKSKENHGRISNAPSGNHYIHGRGSPRNSILSQQRRKSNYSHYVHEHHHHSDEDLGCHGHDNHGHQHGVPLGASTMSAVFLMLALSLHGVFEGWAAASTFKGTNPWSNGMATVVALAAHKWVEGFVLSLSLLKADFDGCKFFLLNFLCACSSPIGVIIYTAAHNVAEEQMQIIGPYLNALACGTLIYVGVTEIVPEVFECDTAKSASKAAAKFLTFVAAGAGLMVFLYYFHECDHSNSSPTLETGAEHQETGDDGQPVWCDCSNLSQLLDSLLKMFARPEIKNAMDNMN
ncbi:unnamed protein product [Amoebophrya sp. A120]|nr:unnamed protein product [Amoebophrya sp. A120]|eukprot:GSA120T00024461001.1